MAGVKGSFSRAVRRYAADTPIVGNEIKKAVAKEFLTAVVPATPVKTGQARSNWNAGISRPDFSTRPTEGRSGDRALQRGSRTIAAAKPGQAVHISNGLPYIQRLNEGWSSQAPAGYIERARAAASALLPRLRFAALRKLSR